MICRTWTIYATSFTLIRRQQAVFEVRRTETGRPDPVYAHFDKRVDGANIPQARASKISTCCFAPLPQSPVAHAGLRLLHFLFPQYLRRTCTFFSFLRKSTPCTNFLSISLADIASPATNIWLSRRSPTCGTPQRPHVSEPGHSDWWKASAKPRITGRLQH